MCFGYALNTARDVIAFMSDVCEVCNSANQQDERALSFKTTQQDFDISAIKLDSVREACIHLKGFDSFPVEFGVPPYSRPRGFEGSGETFSLPMSTVISSRAPVRCLVESQCTKGQTRWEEVSPQGSRELEGTRVKRKVRASPPQSSSACSRVGVRNDIIPRYPGRSQLSIGIRVKSIGGYNVLWPY